LQHTGCTCPIGLRQGAADHDGARRHAAVGDFTGFAVVDRRALADVNAHGKDRVLADDDAFDDFRTGADEAVVFDDGRVGLQRLKHAADADTAGEVHVFADLGAGTDGNPGVDHGAFIDVGADVHVGRHQHGVLGDEGTLADDGARHDAEAALAELLFAPAFELGVDLVVETDVAGFLDAVVAGTEGEQHGLLDPLVGDPFAVDLLGDAQLAGVEVANHRFDGGNGVDRGLRGQLGAAFPEFVDGGLQGMVMGNLSGYSCWAN
jgi:hypothetical protein